MVIFGVGPRAIQAVLDRPVWAIWQGFWNRDRTPLERNAMKATNTQASCTPVTTRVLRLNTSGENPWVVCTLDAVPVILARFSSQTDAENWQGSLSPRQQAA